MTKSDTDDDALEPEPSFLTVRDVMRELQLSRSAAYELMRTIGAAHIGRSVRLSREHWHKYLQAIGKRYAYNDKAVNWSLAACTRNEPPEPPARVERAIGTRLRRHAEHGTVSPELARGLALLEKAVARARLPEGPPRRKK